MFCTSMNLRRRKSTSTPARMNSSTSIGRSKRLELNPPKSHPSMNWASERAICANEGHSFTSSSVIPWMAVASAGICMPGLMRRVLTVRSPSGLILTIEISTIRSLAVSIPVVSRSKKMIGRLRLSFIWVRSGSGVNHHRHEQHERRAALLVVVNGFENTRTSRIRELDLHGRRFDIRQDLHQERRFEPDGDLLPVVAAADGLIGRHGEVDVLSREVDAVFADIHADQVGGGIRADRHALDAVEQLDAVHEHLVGVGRRNHGVVVGIIALDQPADQRVVFELENSVLRVEPDRDGLLLAQEHRTQQVGRFLGQDERGREVGFGLGLVLDQLVRVRAHESEQLGCEVDIHAVHHRAQLVVRRCEDGLVDAPDQGIHVERDLAVFCAERRHGGIAHGAGAGNGEFAAFPVDADLPVLVVHLDFERELRELLERVEHELRRSRYGAFASDGIDRDGSRQGCLQVGGGYLQLGAFELHEEVIEDRKRVFIADDLSRGRQEREQGGA
nr:MAG TPA: hypothetical protein [Caudoviricetes sp.]